MSANEKLSGNEAAAFAIKQINPDVIAAFPITPSTEIPQYISQLKADNEITTEFITVESEHSAISACVGAQAGGVRAMTATSSCGLALMHEILYVAASNRLPIVMVVVNRALSGPININADHSDSMGSRDSGWIQLYSENCQEVYDNILMAHRIAENPEILLPIMICQDGFITSHSVENIILEDDLLVKKFIGEYKPEKYLLNPNEPLSVGPYDHAAYYMEHKQQQSRAMEKAIDVIQDISKEFSELTGRYYELVESYHMDDAQFAVVIIGSSAGTGKAAVDILRAKGKKVGLLKIRSFRPFPSKALIKELINIEALAILDKADSFSANGGPLGTEIRSILFNNLDGIKTINYIYGLGGRDISVDDFFKVFNSLEEIDNGSKHQSFCYLGVREQKRTKP